VIRLEQEAALVGLGSVISKVTPGGPEMRNYAETALKESVCHAFSVEEGQETDAN